MSTGKNHDMEAELRKFIGTALGPRERRKLAHALTEARRASARHSEDEAAAHIKRLIEELAGDRQLREAARDLVAQVAPPDELVEFIRAKLEER